MKLYHGTKESLASDILNRGLIPRKEGDGNWEHTILSNPNQVYLTTAYAGYFAAVAADGDEKWCIVEVETGRLCHTRLVPDEDWMEQATRHENIRIAQAIEYPEAADMINGTMEERTKFFRDNIREWAGGWPSSILGLGNCAYQGEIPTSAITRVTTFDPKENKFVANDMDPTISMMNYKFMGDKYRAATKWLIGRKITMKQFQGIIWEGWLKTASKDIQREYRRLLRDHVGVEVIYAER